MISYEKVKDNPTVFLAFTGLEQTEFEKLLISFTLANRKYIEKHQLKGKKTTAPVWRRTESEISLTS